MLERLDGEDAEHFATVRRLLEHAGIAYELDGTLVRGLDYYTRTVFEFHCGRLGAQSQVAGGGRYDGLIELLGGPATPACGWAVGVERILLALEGEQTPQPPDVFVAAADDQRERALALATELRHAGLARRARPRGSRPQGADEARRPPRRRPTRVILDENGTVQLRDMSSGEQREVEVAEPGRGARRTVTAHRPSGAAPERLSRRLVRPGARRPGRLDRAGGGVGPSPPRPRRPGVRRPPRPDRPRPARLQPGDRRGRLPARP